MFEYDVSFYARHIIGRSVPKRALTETADGELKLSEVANRYVAPAPSLVQRQRSEWKIGVCKIHIVLVPGKV